MSHFWKNKRVFITGHTGFKGSWLSLWLQSFAANVTGLSLLPPSIPNLFTLASVEKGMTSYIGDLRDYSLVQKIVNECQPDIVFHMAAQSLVRYSYQNPIETYATNALGTVHLFEALRQSNTVKAIINVTSDKCYENKEWVWGYRENDRLGGHDPYSNSKACAELITSAYRSSYFKEMNIGLASVRAGNVIGGGDWAEDRLIPDIIRGYFNKQPVSIRNPTAIRPWQHVLEPLSGYLLLAEQLYHSPSSYAESWNFGPYEDDVKPVGWINEFISQRLGHISQCTQTKGQQPYEAAYLKLDCAKAKSRLGWLPSWNLEKTLEETLNWYQAYRSGENMHSFTLAQIQQFISPTIKMREGLNDNTKVYSCSLR